MRDTHLAVFRLTIDFDRPVYWFIAEEGALVDDRHQDQHEAEKSYRRIELISGDRRRRHWSAAERARILEESFVAGANVSEVARRNGINRGLLFTWRRQAHAALREHSDAECREGAASAFVPIVESGLMCTTASGPAAGGTIDLKANRYLCVGQRYVAAPSRS